MCSAGSQFWEFGDPGENPSLLSVCCSIELTLKLLGNEAYAGSGFQGRPERVRTEGEVSDSVQWKLVESPGRFWLDWESVSREV